MDVHSTAFPQPTQPPFIQLFIKKLPLVYLFSKMTLFSYFLSEKGTISPISFRFFSCDFFLAILMHDNPHIHNNHFRPVPHNYPF